MKSSNIYSCICIILLFITAFFPYELILAQDQNTIQVNQQDKVTIKQAHDYLTLSLSDSVWLVLSNFNKGLLYCDSIFLKHPDKRYLYKYLGEEKSIMIKSTFSELELDILEQNLRLINKQSNIRINEWIRKDKLDLNLGEVIKGFYIQPMFE